MKTLACLALVCLLMVTNSFRHSFFEIIRNVEPDSGSFLETDEYSQLACARVCLTDARCDMVSYICSGQKCTCYLYDNKTYVLKVSSHDTLILRSKRVEQQQQQPKPTVDLNFPTSDSTIPNGHTETKLPATSQMIDTTTESISPTTSDALIFTPSCATRTRVNAHWEEPFGSGIYRADLDVFVDFVTTTSKWKINFITNTETWSFVTWKGIVEEKEKNGRWYRIKNRYNFAFAAGGVEVIKMQVKYKGETLPNFQADFLSPTGAHKCSGLI